MSSRLYDEDFYSWTQEQAQLLRQAATLRRNAPPGVDWELLAEEIEDLGRDKLEELFSRYVVLLKHLLKWRCQPLHRSGSWESSIKEQRYRVERLIRKNPGVKPKRAEEYAEAYDLAREGASRETGLRPETFPTDNPFTLAQAESPDFWPEAESEA